MKDYRIVEVQHGDEQRDEVSYRLETLSKYDFLGVDFERWDVVMSTFTLAEIEAYLERIKSRYATKARIETVIKEYRF